AAALAAALDDTTAAVILEPIQGENGVVEPPSGFLGQVRDLTRAAGALLWVDEVQTGIGRCGDWLASAASGVTADIVTFAKGLGNGFPIGACVATGAAADLLQPGSHGTTFGGNPVAAAAGLAVMGIIERDGLLQRSVDLGDRLAATILGLGHPDVLAVRGRGLLRGVVLARPIAAAVADAALEAGYVINAPRPDVLRLAPPLVVPAEGLDAFAAALPALLEGVA
ncbi:MAG: aminotransferase class III-fold pyridoxal phosphate-dependent enzyme, partial [Propionicimonas sp.]|nr:aminotransferase class III-fold pyridoxal phosphate-dependent enzyme [Propionicimonas sp.]